MTTPEEEAYLQQETKKNLALLYTPGSRICSEESGNERLVIGEHQTTFLLTVCTKDDGSQDLEPIVAGKLPKVARVVAEGRKYSVIPLEKSEHRKNEQRQASDFQVGNYIVSESGTVRLITQVQGDTVSTISKKNDQFVHKDLSLQKKLLDPTGNQWIYAVLPPSETTFLLESFLSKEHTTVLGNTAENELKHTIELFSTPRGHQVVAACDIGYQEGRNAERPNQDRVVINPKQERYAVIDGLGGKPDGHVIAQMLAEEIAKSEVSIPETIENARDKVQVASKTNTNLEHAGATFVTAEVIREHGKIYIEENHLGDSQLLILDRQGNPVYLSQNDSLGARVVNATNPHKSELENARKASRHPHRNVVSQSFQAKDQEPDKTNRIEVQPGYRVILMTDGISDTLLPDEIASLIKDTTPLQAMQIISDVTTKRFKASETLRSENPGENENYSDGFYQEPKPDNRALVIFDVN